jgi:phosphoribosylformylglycinamidine cyclo-ligase
MPGIYHGNDLDLAGFIVGIVDQKQVLGRDRVREGDLVIALESSGFHSNGFSLIRKLVEMESLRPDSASPLPGKNWKEALLTPTVLYGPYLTPFLDKIHALAHITGGGLYENLPRVLPSNLSVELIKKDWPLTPLFQWAKKASGLSDVPFFSTLNAGVGMIAILPSTDTPGLLSSLESQNLKAWEIGRVTSRTSAIINWK